MPPTTRHIRWVSNASRACWVKFHEASGHCLYVDAHRYHCVCARCVYDNAVHTVYNVDVLRYVHGSSFVSQFQFRSNDNDSIIIPGTTNEQPHTPELIGLNKLVVPPQSCLLHNAHAPPTQPLPPFAGAGLLQVLLLVPTAQAVEHAPNRDHPPSTSTSQISK